MPSRGKPNGKYQGSKWISRPTRLAIYLRDGMACVYCGNTVEDGASLTLDHLTPYREEGVNHHTNLVTACHRCNSSRGDRSWEDFAKAVAEYLNRGVTAEKIINHITHCVCRPIDINAAKELIKRHGSWQDTLAKHKEQREELGDAH